MKIKNAYCRNVEPGTSNYLPGKTQQHFGPAVSLKNLVSKYERCGRIPPPTTKALFQDFTNAGDFQEAQNKILRAENAFMSLPVHIRDYFGHNPANLLRFVYDDKNREKAIEIGLIERTETEPESKAKALDLQNKNDLISVPK